MFIGRQLSIDAVTSSDRNLNNITSISTLLHTIAGIFGKRVIQPTAITQNTSGISVSALWPLLHITIHTSSLVRTISLDIYSQEEFDPRYVLSQIHKTFDVKTLHSTTMERFTDASPKLESQYYDGKWWNKKS